MVGTTFAQGISQDPSCAEVNDAYLATRSSRLYSAKYYDSLPNGYLKPLGEMRVDLGTAIAKGLDETSWEEVDPSVWSLLDRFGPKFRSCKLVEEQGDHGRKIRHFTATWHRFPQAAYVDVWIAAEEKRTVRVERRTMHPSAYKFGTTSGTMVEVFIYEHPMVTYAYQPPNHARIEDTSCAEVNYAYVVTQTNRAYRRLLYDLPLRGKRRQLAETLIAGETLYFKRSDKQNWRRASRADWSLFDFNGPKIISCGLQKISKESGDRVVQYLVTWNEYPLKAYADVWLSSKSKRLLKIERRFINVSLANNQLGTTDGTTLEIFDYNSKKAIAPEGSFDP